MHLVSQSVIFCVNESKDVAFTLQEALGQRALLSYSGVTLMWSLTQGSCKPDPNLTLKETSDQELDTWTWSYSTGAEL